MEGHKQLNSSIKEKDVFDSRHVKAEYANKENVELANNKLTEQIPEKLKFVLSITLIISLVSLMCSLTAVILISDTLSTHTQTSVEVFDKHFLTGYLGYMPEQNCQILRNNLLNEEIPLQNGVYYLQDADGIVYPAYCDMTTDNGGWTLVASVHENNLGDKGRCTLGDKWSSEQGNTTSSPEDNNWKNRKTFGNVISAASDDYKNQAYFELKAKNIMIWQVPNNTPLNDFNTSAYLRYRTTSGFLDVYGNLLQLFNNQSHVQNKTYTECGDGNGLSVDVTYDVGNKTTTTNLYGPAVHNEMEAGYIQFHATRPPQETYAMCMGVRPRNHACNPQYYCVGSLGNSLNRKHCGDFSFFDADGYGSKNGRSADKQLVESVFMIFYR